MKLDKFRQLRNDIEYRTSKATMEETKELKKLTKIIIKKMKNRI